MNNIRRFVCIFLVSTAFIWCQRPNFSAEDWWLWRTISDAQIRGDGQWVVYREAHRDHEADREFANLWLASTDGRQRRPYTEGKWVDDSPRWSPDGARIAWISDRSGRRQIRVRNFAGGDDVVLETPQLPLSLVWSPEGDRIAYTARAGASIPPPAWAPAALLPFLRRTGDTRTALYVLPSGGGPVQRVSADDFDCQGDPSWLLDGQRLVAAGTDGIYLLPVPGGAAKALVKAPGRYESPQVSPEGGKIAYLYKEDRPQSYTTRKLYVMNTDGSRGKVLSGSLDRDAAFPRWSSEGRTVYFIAEDRGSTHVYAARNDGTVRQVTERLERLRGFSLSDTGRAASVRESGTEGGNVVSFTVDVVSQPVSLDAPNEHLLAERSLGALEALSWTSDGRTIQGWVVRPSGSQAGKQYPLLVDVRDDPREMCGVEFSLRAQFFAARGFVVLCANPRGTPGYGEEFGNLLRTRYPGDDFDDLMRGVDAVIAKGYVDPKRLTLSGGLLAAWAIGHTNRFARVVAKRPVVDWAVDVATAPDGRRRAAEWMRAMPWEDTDQYVKHSPLSFAASFVTPTLVLAGDPDPQSEQLYFALRERKVETTLARIPVGRPSGEWLEWEAELAWLGKN